MEKFDSIILVIPHVGEYHGTNVFLRNLTDEEIEFLEKDLIIEYRHKNNSYIDCMKDLKDKIKKIKAILQE